MRAKRWHETPLGPPDSWPQSLRTVVRILLTSRYQMWMCWGPQLTMFYNDAYGPTLGVKQQWALGASAREVWKEIWPDIGPRIEHVLQSGEATWDEGLLLFLERSGYPEETYHTFSYSPLADDDGSVVGMLCVVTEETERIIGERRLFALQELAAGIAGNNALGMVFESVPRLLSRDLKDLPFTLTYLFDERGDASLACCSGVESNHPIAPARIDPQDPNAAWPAEEILARRTALNLSDLKDRFAALPMGAWDKPPREAIITPIAQQGRESPAGFLVAGINPYRRMDDAYLGFINLVAGQISSGLANAWAYEEAQRRAEALAELDRAKTAFFSNVSHEFRTPLTLMLAPLEDVLKRPPADPLSEHSGLIQVAHRNGVRLLKLVNTLLDFSRIEAGRTQAYFEPVELAAYTAELASNFRSAIERAGLRLNVNCQPLPEAVYLDRDMWEKVILNLLSNAFKFTFEGSIAVETRCSDDGERAEITVRDTGTGIPAGELAHLFDRFRRVAGARGRSIEGSGIGLALVRELVNVHGGTISVASEMGQGSAFTVALRFGSGHLPGERVGKARAEDSGDTRAQAYIDEALSWLGDASRQSAASAPGAAELAPIAPVVGAAGQRILIADDNVDMRIYLRKLLQTAGFQVEAVGDGERALAAALDHKPDLVLSDVMMPKMDGFASARGAAQRFAVTGGPGAALVRARRRGSQSRRTLPPAQMTIWSSPSAPVNWSRVSAPIWIWRRCAGNRKRRCAASMNLWNSRLLTARPICAQKRRAYAPYSARATPTRATCPRTVHCSTPMPRRLRASKVSCKTSSASPSGRRPGSRAHRGCPIWFATPSRWSPPERSCARKSISTCRRVAGVGLISKCGRCATVSTKWWQLFRKRSTSASAGRRKQPCGRRKRWRASVS